MMEGSPNGSAADPGSAAPAPVPRKLTRRWLALAAVLAAVAVVLASILVLGPSAPWQEAVLTQGRTFLDVPLAALYTAPSAPDQTVNTSAHVSYSSGFWLGSSSAVGPSSIFYEWSVDSGTALPVKFVLESSWPSNRSSWFEDLPNALGYFPAGPLPPRGSAPSPNYVNGTLVGPDLQGIFVTKWAMNYTVRKMGVMEGLTPREFFEVDYSLAVIEPGSVRLIVSTNVSAPLSTDLVATSQPFSVAPGVTRSLGGNSLSIDSRSPFTDYQPFHYNDTHILLYAGTAGVLGFGLHSTSWWSATCASMNQCWPTEDYTLNVSFSNQTAWFQVYIDRRFGSLLIQYVPPPGL